MKKFLVLIMALVIAPMAFAQGSYRIQAGDTLAISVLEDPNLNRSVLVRPDGGISLPIAGNIQAGGNSISAVERLVTERLASGFSIKPTVSVALASVGPIATAVAQESRIQLRRTDRNGRETIFLFDYDAVQDGAQIVNNLAVQSGDVIVVPERRLFE